MSYYAADGSTNVSVVDGSTYVGLYAADGSLNVVAATGSTYVGASHPSGALWVTLSPGSDVPMRAPDGSLYVNENNKFNQGMRVTVVAGTLHPGPSGPIDYFYYLGGF